MVWSLHGRVCVQVTRCRVATVCVCVIMVVQVTECACQSCIPTQCGKVCSGGSSEGSSLNSRCVLGKRTHVVRVLDSPLVFLQSLMIKS